MRRVLSAAFFAIFCLTALPGMAAEGRVPLPNTSPVLTPILITQPGSYILTRNLLTTSPANPLVIIDCNLFPPQPAPAVTLNLNGFVLDNAANPSQVIQLIDGAAAPRCEVTIRNGEVIGGTIGIEALGPMRKVVIEDVEVKDSSGDGISLLDVEEVAIRRNTVIDTQGVGIHVHGVWMTSGTIEDNLVRRTFDGIDLEMTRSVEISNNRIEEIASGPQGAGIALVDSQNILVSQNTIDDVSAGGPGPWVGIRLLSPAGFFTSGCKVVNNLVHTTGNEGIYLDFFAEGNLVKDNVVRWAQGDGILVNGNRNRIEGNVITDNGLGPGGGFGLRFGPNALSNQYGGNTAEGNSGTAALCPPGLGMWSPNFCDMAAGGFPNPPGPGPNFSFVNNLMPGLAGPI